MAAAYQDRIERLDRLAQFLPLGAAPDSCPDGAQILRALDEIYGKGSDSARRRALQRDLEELVKAERIEAVNPGGKPLRYRRVTGDLDDDPDVWAYTLRQIKELVAGTVPQRQLDRLWQRLLSDKSAGPLLDETRLRIVPDTLRLQPVPLNPAVVRAVIVSLARGWALQVDYRDAERERATARLHPQALVQRGPIPYLFALKNDETKPVRLYALHRMLQAQVLSQVPARPAVGFDLDQAIAKGLVDFGQGKLINLTLRVRGYVADLVSVCPLASEQHLPSERPGSDFKFRLRARVPSTGQLLRWLLGAGDNVEVLAPADLRRVIAAQTAKAAALYAAPVATADPDGTP